MLLTSWSIGIMTVVLLGQLGPWLIVAIGVAAVVAVINRALALVSGLALLALLLGAGRGALAPTVQLPAGITGQAVAVAGAVDDDPVGRKTSTRIVVRLDHILTSAGQQPSRLRIEATVYGVIPVHYGDLVLLSGTLEQPPVFEQFDYRTYLAEQGIAGVMPSAKLVRVTAHGGDPLHQVLFTVRHALIDAVDRSLPEPQAAMLLGVVFGYRAALPATLQQQMIASGFIRTVLVHTDVRYGADQSLDRRTHLDLSGDVSLPRLRFANGQRSGWDRRRRSGNGRSVGGLLAGCRPTAQQVLRGRLASECQIGKIARLVVSRCALDGEGRVAQGIEEQA